MPSGSIPGPAGHAERLTRYASTLEQQLAQSRAYSDALSALDLTLGNFSHEAACPLSTLPLRARRNEHTAPCLAVLATRLEQNDAGDALAELADPSGVCEASITRDCFGSDDVITQGSALILTDVPLLVPRITASQLVIPIVDSTSVMQVFHPSNTQSNQMSAREHDEPELETSNPESISEPIERGGVLDVDGPEDDEEDAFW